MAFKTGFVLKKTKKKIERQRNKKRMNNTDFE